MRIILCLLFVLLASPASAQVAIDVSTFNGPTTGAFSFTHTPSGTPRAAILRMTCDTTGDCVDAPTYGGVAIPEASCSPNTGSPGPGSTYVYFLGSGIPTGAQTVAISVLNAGSKTATLMTLTATANTEIIACDATINSGSIANPSVTLSLSGRTSWAGLAGVSGQISGAGVAELTNWVSSEIDYGSLMSLFYRYSIVSTADVPCGWTQTSASATMICVAVAEITGGAAPPSGMLIGVGP